MLLCCRLVTLAITTQNMSVVLACAVMALHFSVRSLAHTPHHRLDRVLFAETPAAAVQDVYSHEDPLVTLLVSAAVITLFTLSYLASMAARCSVTCNVSRRRVSRLAAGSPWRRTGSWRCAAAAARGSP